ncbi:glycosyltransferase family 4 protein, partial [Candidatus Roizmanbacteria bacterium]|nr:glycosyltransferase family 4 protein [Candidatus Roizmanbacteria bacterium]
MHFTYFSYPVLYKRKFVATIHDTTPLNFKTGKASTKNPLLYKLKHIAFKFVISQQIKNAQAIISPTKTVKKQLLNIFGNKYESKIFPIYEGIDYELMNLKNISSNVKHLTSNIPFFIYVGNFYPHKNVERLIQAFAKVKKDIRLILLGPDDYFSKRLFQLINRLKQEKRIVFYHNPSRDDLVFFYKNAQALIHPSLSEGFGLPLAEAAYFKLPIIASNIDVFREILDGNYISFNPTDVNDIAAKIKQFLSQKIKYSYDSVLKKFSFKAMTNKTLEIYQKNLRQEADI